jgi:hypothetical protein
MEAGNWAGWSGNCFGKTIKNNSNKKNMIAGELFFLRPEVIGFCGFGIMM